MTMKVKNPFFTADSHFWHEALIKHKYRPGFSTVFEMHDALIERWNKKVGRNDTVFFLGDLTWRTSPAAVTVLTRLNGRVIWIPGNHDKKVHHVATMLGWVVEDKILEIDVVNEEGPMQRISLCHYAMLTWNKMHYGAWHLHGHSHGNLKYPIERPWMDVGADTNNLTPYSYAEVKARLQAAPYEALDHHAKII